MAAKTAALIDRSGTCHCQLYLSSSILLTAQNLSVNGGNDSVNLGHIKSTVPHEFR